MRLGDLRDASFRERVDGVPVLVRLGSGDGIKAACASPLSERIEILYKGSSRSDEGPFGVGVTAVGYVRLMREIGLQITYPIGESMRSALSARWTGAPPGVGSEAVLDEGVSWLRVGEVSGRVDKGKREVMRAYHEPKPFSFNSCRGSRFCLSGVGVVGEAVGIDIVGDGSCGGQGWERRG